MSTAPFEVFVQRVLPRFYAEALDGSDVPDGITPTTPIEDVMDAVAFHELFQFLTEDMGHECPSFSRSLASTFGDLCSMLVAVDPDLVIFAYARLLFCSNYASSQAGRGGLPSVCLRSLGALVDATQEKQRLWWPRLFRGSR